MEQVRDAINILNPFIESPESLVKSVLKGHEEALREEGVEANIFFNELEKRYVSE